LKRPREAPTKLYPPKIPISGLKSAIISLKKVLSVIRVVTVSPNVTYIFFACKSELKSSAWSQIFGATAQKSAIYGEGCARHASPGAQESAIPEKEIVIFALRKALFPGKAWWKLPGAWLECIKYRFHFSYEPMCSSRFFQLWNTS
jgi:hypothetical protein